MYLVHQCPNHKIHIYLEYHSVCPLVWIGTPPPPLPLSRVSPRNLKEGTPCLRVRGWEGPNLDDGKKGLALCFTLWPQPIKQERWKINKSWIFHKKTVIVILLQGVSFMPPPHLWKALYSRDQVNNSRQGERFKLSLFFYRFVWKLEGGLEICWDGVVIVYVCVKVL